jgi:Uma2 family endonuclease
MQLADLDLNKVYTYADYYGWDFEERVELINGKVFALPTPNRYHQFIAGQIHLALGIFLRSNPCSVYFAPFDVRLPRKSNKDEDIITVLQPDLCVICDKSKLSDPRGCLGTPDIVVEILSPSNGKKELKYKYEVYEEVGSEGILGGVPG